MTGFASAISYHANGMIKQITHANGVKDVIDLYSSSMTRPGKIETQGATGGDWSSGAYSYDGAGNITAIDAGLTRGILCLFLLLIIFVQGLVRADNLFPAPCSRENVVLTGDSAYTLSFDVSSDGTEVLDVEFTFTNDGPNSIFLFDWDVLIPLVHRPSLDFLVGYPFDRESAVPRLRYVHRGESVKRSFRIHHEIREYSQITITVFLIATDVEHFRTEFGKLRGDETQLFLDEGSPLWDEYYRSLTAETVVFPIPKVTASRATGELQSTRR